MTEGLALGVDIGGTRTKLGLISRRGEILRSSVFSSQGFSQPQEFVQALVDQIHSFLTPQEAQSLLGVGVGAPNANPHLGKMIQPTHFPWEEVDLSRPLQEALAKSVVLDNDACVAGFGEQLWGQAQGCQNFAVLTLGTGVGVSVFVQGQVLRGPGGVNGEFGHFPLFAEGRPCACGGQGGHLEPYLSVSGMLQTIKETGGLELTWPEVLDRFLQPQVEPSLEEALREVAQQLGRALATLHVICGPERFILSGGGSLLGQRFCNWTQEALEIYTFPSFRGQAQVRVSEISSEAGAVLGAAALAFFRH